MLGGSHFQVPSIKKAKEMGNYVITCDNLVNNPGHRFSDEYYNVSTTNKEEVLKLAKKLNVDGVVCYASDPSAPTAAFVCEKMCFPTSPYRSIEILSNKDLFRYFLKENEFCVPKAKGYNSLESAMQDFESYNMPVMVKPVDSSGSKGVTKIDKLMDLKSSVDKALEYSRAKRFIIEEYIDKLGYQIAGDGFSVNGELVFYCFAHEHFDSNGKFPFVPIGESWPYNMSERLQIKIYNEIQRLLYLLDMKNNALNFDIRIDSEENVYLMEIGPRNGGNLIPQVTKYATGIDMVTYTIKSALGQDCTDLSMSSVNGFWSCYMIHSKEPGILKEVFIDDEFRENNIVEFDMFYNYGDSISAFTGSNGTLGTMILKFQSLEEMLQKMDNMSEYIKVRVN